jgi:transposase-like protein
MARYSAERKAAVLKKLLPPQNRSVVWVAAEEGIFAVTLYSWLKQCRQQGMPVPGNRNTGEDWSPEAKLAVVVEMASMSEAELSAYCRQKGLYPERVQRCLRVLACKKDWRKRLRSSKETLAKRSRSERRKSAAKTES